MSEVALPPLIDLRIAYPPDESDPLYAVKRRDGEIFGTPEYADRKRRERSAERVGVYSRAHAAQDEGWKALNDAAIQRKVDALKRGEAPTKPEPPRRSGLVDITPHPSYGMGSASGFYARGSTPYAMRRHRYDDYLGAPGEDILFDYYSQS